MDVLFPVPESVQCNYCHVRMRAHQAARWHCSNCNFIITQCFQCAGGNKASSAYVTICIGSQLHRLEHSLTHQLAPIQQEQLQQISQHELNKML